MESQSENKVNWRTITKALLDEVLIITGSGYGYIGEVDQSSMSTYLKFIAISDSKWDAPTQIEMNSHVSKGFRLRDTNLVLGDALHSKRVEMLDRTIEVGKSTERLKSSKGFSNAIAIPVLNEGQIVGMIFLANSDLGFSEGVAHILKPLVAWSSHLIINQSMKNETRRLRRMLRENNIQYYSPQNLA